MSRLTLVKPRPRKHKYIRAHEDENKYNKIMSFLQKEIEIVEASEQDNWKLLDLLMTNYPDLGWWSKAFMQWLYFDNPAGKVKNWVAKYKGGIIANVTAIPHKLFINGKIETSWRVQDVITHAEYRGLGLYTKLANCTDTFLKQEQFPINFTFPNESSHQGFMKRDWIKPNRIPLWINNEIQNINPQSISLNIEPITTFTEQDEQIWKSFCVIPKYAIDRNFHYLNWRYFQNPRGGYFAFRLSNKKKSAICILKLFTNSTREKYAHLVDYFYDDGFKKEKDIVQFYINFSIENKIKLATTWIQPQAQIAKHLNTNGFKLDTNLTRWHVLNINCPEQYKTEICNLGNWHISMGDSDVY